MIFLRTNCPNFIGLVWGAIPKFRLVSMAAALPAVGYRFQCQCNHINVNLSESVK